ncbi:hypothetical protein ACFLTR_04395 [Chloroflexota bacterium]
MAYNYCHHILAIVIPLESSEATEPKDVIKKNVEEMKETASQLGQEIRSTFVSKEGASEEAVKTRCRSHNILGIILIVIGILDKTVKLRGELFPQLINTTKNCNERRTRKWRK